MTHRVLQLVFDPAAPMEAGSETDTVLCVAKSEGSAAPVVSIRAFLKEDYEQTGRELCLWWLRQFSTSDAEGESLHELFEWDGWSALWFSHALFLYPEWGAFLKLMVAARSLELLRDGTYAEVRVIGNEPTLAQVFRENGFRIDLPEPPSVDTPPSIDTPPSTVIPAKAGIQGRIGKALRTLRYLYLDPLRYRHGYPQNHAPLQTESVFYSVQFGEWEMPGSGNHRYLSETVEELLEAGIARSARPLVFGRPTLSGDSQAWEDFLSYSVVEKEALYPMVFNTPALGRRLLGWARALRPKVEGWLARNRKAAFHWRGFDLTALAYPIVRASIEDAARKILLYEVTKKALLAAKPKALILKDEVYPDGRNLIAAARRAGVRTVAFQHGSIYPTHWCYRMDPESNGIGRPPLPDAFGVYGAAVGRLLVEKGGFPDSIFHVTGARRFRSLNNARASEEIRTLAASGKPIVLVAGQLHPDMPRLYDWMFRITEATPEAQFIIKPHPRDRDWIPRIEAHCARLVNAHFYRGPLREVLPASKLVVSGHSTVLLEAVWLGIGAISVQISGEEPAEWLTEAGLIRIVGDYDQLTAALGKGVGDTLFTEADRARAERYLEEYLGSSAVSEKAALMGVFE